MIADPDFAERPSAAPTPASTPAPAPAPAPVKVFVAATGNGFMRDIAEWLVDAATIAGRQTALIDDALPCADGSINLVVAPHEFFELTDAPTVDLQRAAAASVCVCTEQPGTPWFHLAVDACRRGMIALDINPHGVEALRAIGVDAHHLQLGGTPLMVADDAGADRPIDVLFMGGLDDRRGAVLAELAPRLYRHNAELRLFRFDRPITPNTPGVVFGTDKYRLLASSKLLLNIHRDRTDDYAAGEKVPAYFEWARMLEAMANGCAVVTEPSEVHEPLVADRHFIEAQPSQMADALDQLLGDPARLAQIRDAASDAVMNDLDLSGSLSRALDRIEADVLPRLASHVATSAPSKGLWRLGATKVIPPIRLGPFRPVLSLQTAAKRVALAENAALRRLDAVRCVLRHGADQHIERIQTSAYVPATPEVSVLITLYDYADVVIEALDSVLASEEVTFEVIVVEDHATDASRDIVRDYLAAHDDVPMMLIAKDANEGLAAARNTGFDAARAPLVMVIDADNAIYPTALAKLAGALRTNPTAAAAYSILEDFGSATGVRSAVAWDVDRLCAANYIDAQAMWRVDAWRRLGGYRADDDEVYGWEDWDLWLRLADSGGAALLVPQILGRYRVQLSSMISLTNLATDGAIDAIRARYPRLPWPPLPPR
jgi:Glycosyl transferase family 2/Glycosyl transferases group 1